MQRLKKREEFLAAARGATWATRSCVVQMNRRRDAGPARIGFTATRKLGGAVARNRIRRRIREAVRLFAGPMLLAGRDYVFIGRAGTDGRTFELIGGDIVHALGKLNAGKTQPRRGKGPAERGRRPNQGPKSPT